MAKFPQNIRVIPKLMLAVVFLASHLVSTTSRSVENNINQQYLGEEYLDREGKYFLKWRIESEEEKIYFEITAQTTGYVGLGISPNGGMAGADILIAGIKADGTKYFSDYHAITTSTPIIDEYQDWDVTDVFENETHTTVHVSRLLNTCDDDDLAITDGTVKLIWSLGGSDDISYHANRGTKSVSFYLSDGQDNFNPDNYNTTDFLVDMVMLAQPTTYWCNIHRPEVLLEKNHVVAFDAVLDNALALEHTHHFIIFRCSVPEDVNATEVLGPWVDHPGDHCYSPNNPEFPFNRYCNRNYVYVWSKGGKRLEFPESMGLPIPEKPGTVEFYASEIHYDNPKSLPGLKFETGARMYHTPNTREEEVGLLMLFQAVQPQMTIPPLSEDFVVSAHCSEECTEKFIPDSGITVFNNLLHAHLAGRKLKVRHFRKNQELPWMDLDEYYDFDFQQNKPLKSPRKVEKGDQLTIECVYDTRKAEGGMAVIGGLGTKEEMCQAFMYYYPRQEVTECLSVQETTAHLNLLGMTNYTVLPSVPGGLTELNITEPAHLAGNYLDSVSTKVQWTEEFRQRYQQEKRYGEQVGTCKSGEGEVHSGSVKYPAELEEYVPINECEGRTRPPGGEGTDPPTGCEGENCSGALSLKSYILFGILSTFVVMIFN